MFRSAMTSMLNKHVWLQYILVILPFLMVIIYGFAYLTDMLSVARNLAYNNSISEAAWGTDSLHEVLALSVIDEQNYAIISGDSTDTVTVPADTLIFYVQMYSENWYQYVTQSSGSIMTEGCSLFDVIDSDDGVYTIKHEDFEAEFMSGDLVCGISITEDGLWLVKFFTEDAYSYTTDELYIMELISEEDGLYTVRVSGNYRIAVDNVELHFCSVLPTDSIYYNDNTGSFVTNVVKDYPWTFMLRSNIGIVLVATALLCFLLYRLSLEDKLILLKHRYIVNVNIVALVCLALCVPFTLMML